MCGPCDRGHNPQVVLENRIAERRKVESPGCFLGSATYPYVSLAIMCAYISPKRCTEDVL